MAWDELRASYDTVAGKYESRFLDELAAKPRDRELLAAFAGSVPDPVVDIGCGPGQIGGFVRAAGRQVFGLDLSARMTALARVRLDGALVADMRSLPLATGRVGGLDEFVGEPVRVAATFFGLDELVAASRAAGLVVTWAERRSAYASESQTVRLYVEAERPASR